MSTMVLEVYDALKEAGASEVSARRAAEAVLAGDTARLDGIDQHLQRHDSRFDKLDARFDRLDARLERIEATLSRIDGRVSTHNWMIGACTTLVIVVLGKLPFLTH